MLDDVKHVEAVAIMRTLVEDPSDFHAQRAAEQWLAENHPAPEVYVAALSSLASPKPDDAPKSDDVCARCDHPRRMHTTDGCIGHGRSPRGRTNCPCSLRGGFLNAARERLPIEGVAVYCSGGAIGYGDPPGRGPTGDDHLRFVMYSQAAGAAIVDVLQQAEVMRRQTDGLWDDRPLRAALDRLAGVLAAEDG